MRRKFATSDLAQQLIGGYLIAGPFVVTDEVWLIAKNMTIIHSIIAILLVIVIGFGALYKADKNRKIEEEEEVGRVPIRLISLIGVAYLSIGSLIFLFNAIEVFDATILTALKVMTIGAIFSILGAAAIDSIL